MRTRILGAVAAVALVLSGCGSDDTDASPEAEQPTPIAVEDASSTSLDEVTVEGEPGERPEVSFEAPLVIEGSEHTVVHEGDGDNVGENQQVTANMTLVSGNTGEELSSSYETGQPSGFPTDTEQISQSLYDAVMEVPVGSRVLLSYNGPARQGEVTQTLIYVIDITGSEEIPEPLSRAEGDEVDPVEGLPEVTRGEDGQPSISTPEGDAPGELTVEPTIQGDGPEVTEGQTVTVHYTGWLWDGGEQFDSSWERGEPFVVQDVPNGPVIEGWNQALLGQNVGSQILVIIPPEQGYGEAGAGENIPPNATLVFVIDILSSVG